MAVRHRIRRPVQDKSLSFNDADILVKGSYLDRIDPLSVEFKPDRIALILQNAETGNLSHLYDLYLKIISTDARIGGMVGNRRMASAQQEWSVSAGNPDNALSVEIAEFVAGNLEYLNVQSIKRELFDAVLMGIKVFENVFWQDGEKRVYLEQLQPISQSRYGFDAYPKNGYGWGEPTLQIIPGKPELISTLPAYKVTEAIYRDKKGYYDITGALRPVVRWYMIKYYCVKFWMQFGETYGFPVSTLTISKEDYDKHKNTMSSFLKNLGRNKYAMFFEGMDFKLHEAQRSTTVDVFDRLIQLANVEMAIALLGQNLTSEVQSGSHAAASVHENTFNMIIGDDTQFMDQVINEQIVDMLVELNYPGIDYELYPTFATIINRNIDKDATARAINTILQIPDMKLRKTDVYDALGESMPNDDEPVFEGRRNLFDEISNTV